MLLRVPGPEMFLMEQNYRQLVAEMLTIASGKHRSIFYICELPILRELTVSNVLRG